MDGHSRIDSGRGLLKSRPPMSRENDIVIIGGGIVGLAAAWRILRRFHARVVVLEAEDGVARHQTGHNSGVIHSGLYYRPGSLKAVNCIRGYHMLLAFCREQGIAHEVCGKVVVATREEELSRLQALEERGAANGLEGVRRLTPEEIREREPQSTGLGGLWVPQTGIIDFREVASRLADLVGQLGGDVRTGHRVKGVRFAGGVIELDCQHGEVVSARHIINCAGLHSDRIARLAGVEPGLQIIPFRGEYYELRPERRHLVRNLIYPVPDPRFPFLGVHFTRMVHGGVEAGPNAVLAFRREGYGRASFSLSDTIRMAGYGGFWNMAARYWKTGMGEFHRSFSKKAFVLALQRLLPSLRGEDLIPGGAGVRAQAVGPDGTLVDDFQIERRERMIHVLNAPSPAATSSLAIGDTLAAMAAEQFSLEARR